MLEANVSAGLARALMETAVARRSDRAALLSCSCIRPADLEGARVMTEKDRIDVDVDPIGLTRVARVLVDSWNRRDEDVRGRDAIAVSLETTAPVLRGIVAGRPAARCNAWSGEVRFMWSADDPARGARRGTITCTCIRQGQTLAGLAWSTKGKVTRREQFLAEMNAVIPWERLNVLIEPYYPSSGSRGRKPLGLEKMLRIYFVQQWFDLSDPAAEAAIYDSESIRRFVGVQLGEEAIPVESTILRFRHLLEKHDLSRGSSGGPGAGRTGRSDCEDASRTARSAFRATATSTGARARPTETVASGMDIHPNDTCGHVEDTSRSV